MPLYPHGQTGPQGPEGPEGPQGPPGDDGAPGTTDYNELTNVPSTFAPSAHASSHVTGGSDVIANVVAGGNAGLMIGSDKTKLDGIAAGAEVNVNADWNSGSGDSQILNKPTFGTMAAETAANYQLVSGKNAANGYAGLSAGSKLTGSQQTYGTGSNTACEGNDSRLHTRQHSVTDSNDHTFPGGTSNFLRADGTFAAPTATAADYNSPETGLVTVATGKYHLVGQRSKLVSSERLTVQGTGRVRIFN